MINNILIIEDEKSVSHTDKAYLDIQVRRLLKYFCIQKPLYATIRNL
ncbi:MAG: hypothetical protein Q8930_08055 [Bacillota bacterium]|nr:hypothetical protein [Bacillota bacterium]